ncbi:MAG: (Fe-S)-binding protein [Actinomycetota bacterium]|nr:(Fe-S)-binding protein [Actinomycetota bacterium]
MTTLDLDPAELSRCVQCGLCLPSCPTFRVTGDESQSPRGRIALMRAVEHDGAPLSPPVLRAFETCVQCRGCETACPSAVPFGHLMARTRAALVDRRLSVPWPLRAAYAGLGHPALVRSGARAIAFGQRLHLIPASLGVPRLALRQPPLAAFGHDVHLFTGCVMDACQRDVHRDTLALLAAAGSGATPTGDRVPCCGALHLHAGLAAQARQLAAEAVRALGDGRPVLVNSAGCGAMLKECGTLLGSAEAGAFSKRVFDVAEWLVPRLANLPEVSPLDLRVAVLDPCHLRHAQRTHTATRDLLTPFVRELVELDDDGLCCGAGGAYALVERREARAIRDRKLASIARSSPDVVVAANPGCAMHLAAGGLDVLHPVTLVARALAGAPPQSRPGGTGPVGNRGSREARDRRERRPGTLIRRDRLRLKASEQDGGTVARGL